MNEFNNSNNVNQLKIADSKIDNDIISSLDTEISHLFPIENVDFVAAYGSAIFVQTGYDNNKDK